MYKIEHRKLDDQITELTKSVESLTEKLGKTLKENELRREAIKVVHAAIQEKDIENQEVKKQRDEFERKLSDYLSQTQVFDVCTTGLFKSLAKVLSIFRTHQH